MSSLDATRTSREAPMNPGRWLTRKSPSSNRGLTGERVPGRQPNGLL